MEVQIDLLVEEVKSNHAPVNDQLILPLSGLAPLQKLHTQVLSHQAPSKG